MSEVSQSDRHGFLAGGNFIVDTVKLIDAWPEQDTLCSILQSVRSNGGGPYNVLKNLANLSPSTRGEACGLIGDDAEGNWLLDDCRSAGIVVDQLQRSSGLQTSATDAMTDSRSGRRTFFHARGANAILAESHFDFSATSAKIFYLGYLMLLDSLDELDETDSTGAARVLANAKNAGLIAAVDCVSTPHPRFKEVAIAALKVADIFFVNEIEAGWILHQDVRFDGAEGCVRKLASYNDQAMIVLHFPEGAVALDPADGSILSQSSVKFPDELIAGATGAGDAFATGFLFGVHEGWPVAECLRAGVCVAASSLTKATPSDGIGALEDCLKLGENYGYR